MISIPLTGGDQPGARGQVYGEAAVGPGQLDPTPAPTCHFELKQTASTTSLVTGYLCSSVTKFGARLIVCLFSAARLLTPRVCHSSSPSSWIGGRLPARSGQLRPLSGQCIHMSVLLQDAFAFGLAFPDTAGLGRANGVLIVGDSLRRTAAGVCKRELTYLFAELPELPDARRA